MMISTNYPPGMSSPTKISCSVAEPDFKSSRICYCAGRWSCAVRRCFFTGPDNAMRGEHVVAQGSSRASKHDTSEDIDLVVVGDRPEGHIRKAHPIAF